MKTFDERMHSIREKSAVEKKKRRNRRMAAGALATVFTVAMALVLFMPYSTSLPDVSRYSDSPYYNVIQGLNKATYSAPKYKNNFHMLASQLANFNFFTKNEFHTNGILGLPQLSPAPGAPMDPTLAVPDGMPNYGDPGDSYEEVTDNQVEGVIEADLFKRSDKYIYYLSNNRLLVYSIAQADTTLAGSFEIDPFAGYDLYGSHATEMYLTADCSTIILLIDGYSKTEGSLATLVTLDVSDPQNIQQKSIMCFTGSYISSRLVGDSVLLTYNYGFYEGYIDFDRPETFVPLYGTPGNMKPIDGDDIVCPEDPTALRYTVVAKMDAKDLTVQDTVAFMSYSQQLYVSADTIYATHAYSKKTEVALNTYTTVSMTAITGVSYAGESLEILGTVQVKGRVKDQYSMDQYDGILRVATSTRKSTEKEAIVGNSISVMVDGEGKNCSLYCIDLATWEIAASVENFAPEGEEVTSARFDGPMAYICTAEIIVLTDPVYFFDLSDLDNITWTDTGIIDGYSSSLVNFGDYLLGIGFGADRGLKIEAYAEGVDSVESLAAYERLCSFSGDYKSYLIDREENLVGMGIECWDEWECGNTFYMLLMFDGYKFREIKMLPMEHYAGNSVRATIVDGWLYVLYDDHLIVQQVLGFDENR